MIGMMTAFKAIFTPLIGKDEKGKKWKLERLSAMAIACDGFLKIISSVFLLASGISLFYTGACENWMLGAGLWGLAVNRLLPPAEQWDEVKVIDSKQ